MEAFSGCQPMFVPPSFPFLYGLHDLSVLPHGFLAPDHNIQQHTHFSSGTVNITRCLLSCLFHQGTFKAWLAHWLDNRHQPYNFILFVLSFYLYRWVFHKKHTWLPNDASAVCCKPVLHLSMASSALLCSYVMSPEISFWFFKLAQRCMAAYTECGRQFQLLRRLSQSLLGCVTFI